MLRNLSHHRRMNPRGTREARQFTFSLVTLVCTLSSGSSLVTHCLGGSAHSLETSFRTQNRPEHKGRARLLPSFGCSGSAGASPSLPVLAPQERRPPYRLAPQERLPPYPFGSAGASPSLPVLAPQERRPPYPFWLRRSVAANRSPSTNELMVEADENMFSALGSASQIHRCFNTTLP